MSYLAARSSKKVRFADVKSVEVVAMVFVRCFFFFFFFFF